MGDYLPQAARIAVAPTVGFLVQLIKGTSLASIIGFVDLMRAAQIVNNATYSPFRAYGLVSVVFFCVCWPLSTPCPAPGAALRATLAKR